MAAFGQMMITNRGLALQAKAQTGTALQFTAIKIGDGQLSGQAIPTLQGLVSQKLSLPISKAMSQTGKATIGAYLSNASLSTGFFFREIGIFATDPAVGEILFAYANSGATAEYIPAAGGPDIVEKYIDLVAIIQSAANVSAVIDNSLALTPLVRKINTEGGLQGGGDFSLDRTLSIAPKGVTQDKIGDKAVGSAQLANGAGTDIVIGNRTITDTAAPTGDSGAVTTLFGWLANMVKAITGKSSWRTAPATTLEAAKVHSDDTARHITTAERTAWNAVGAAGGVTDTIIGNRTVNDATAPTGDTSTVTNLFGWLANMIKAITGKSSWRTAPAMSLETAKQSLDALSTRLTDANTQTTPLVPGQNLITASEAGPVAVTVKGNTLVNLLGTDGGCESLTGWTTGGTVELSAAKKRSGEYSMKITTANSGGFANKDFAYPLDTSKYYIFAAWVFIESWTNGNVQLTLQDRGGSAYRYTLVANTSVIGSWQFVYAKIPTSNTISTTNGFRLSIGSGATTTFVFYVDEARIYDVSAADYAAIGTTIVGEAIDQRNPYVDGVKHITNPVITKIGKNLLPPFTAWTVDGGTQNITGPYEVEVTPSNWNHGPYIVIDSLPLTKYTIRLGETSGIVALDIASRDASNANTAMVSGGLLSSYTFTTPANSVRLWIKIKNGDQTGKYKVANVQLEMGSVATTFEPRNDDYLYAPTTLAGYGGVNDVLTVRGTEATKLKRWITDMVLYGTLAWTLHSTGTGFKVVKIPLTGSVYNSMIAQKYDGKILRGNVGATSAWSADDHMVTGDTYYLAVGITESGWGDAFSPSAAEAKAWANGWKMNNSTFGQPYNGTGTKTWTRWDATSNTGAVTTVPTTMAEGYTPNKLSYQLATPVTEVVPVEGSLANHAGVNVYEAGEGIIVREKVIPYLSSGRYYIIGNAETRKDSSWGTSRTAFAASKLIQVYKNREKNYGWIFSVANNASIDPANMDTTAEYTVTYLALDKYAITAPVVEGALEYKNNLAGVTSELVKQMADNNTIDTIQNGRLLLDEAYIRNLNMDLSAATNAPAASTLMKRDPAGRAQVAAPAVAADIVNRGFLEGSYAPLASPNLMGVPTAPDMPSGQTGNSIANLNFVSNNAANSRKWSAIIRGQTWSRLCKLTGLNITGHSVILHIQGTRSGVVHNYAFHITASHSSAANIVVLAGGTYSSSIRIRAVVNTNGDVFIEVNDTANSIAAGTDQGLYVNAVMLRLATVEIYTSFTSGEALDSGFTVAHDVTTTPNTMGARIVKSYAPQGTAPLQVDSTTKVDKLNVGLLDGQQGSYYATAAAATAAQTKADEAYSRANAAFTQASDGKTAIAAAITGMGQAAAGTDTFAQLATKVSLISNDANAAVGEVLADKTFYQGGKRTGTMPNRSGSEFHVAAGSSINGNNLHFHIPYNGYYSTYNKIWLEEPNWQPNNIRKGTSIFGKTGTLVEGPNFTNGITWSTLGNEFAAPIPNNSTYYYGFDISADGNGYYIRRALLNYSNGSLVSSEVLAYLPAPGEGFYWAPYVFRESVLVFKYNTEDGALYGTRIISYTLAGALIYDTGDIAYPTISGPGYAQLYYGYMTKQGIYVSGQYNTVGVWARNGVPLTVINLGSNVYIRNQGGGQYGYVRRSSWFQIADTKLFAELAVSNSSHNAGVLEVTLGTDGMSASATYGTWSAVNGGIGNFQNVIIGFVKKYFV